MPHSATREKINKLRVFNNTAAQGIKYRARYHHKLLCEMDKTTGLTTEVKKLNQEVEEMEQNLSQHLQNMAFLAPGLPTDWFTQR